MMLWGAASEAVFTLRFFEAIAGEDIHRIIGGYTLPNAATLALHERFGFKQVAVFSEAGRKFGLYWDVGFSERPLQPHDGQGEPSTSG